MYEVNPPLIKAVAALPVTYRAPKYDWKAFDTTPGERCEWAVGRHLISANGANSFQLFTIARWSLLSIWCLGGLVVHKWGSACGGNRGGFAALLLWCFSIEVQAWTPTLCADSSFASLIAASAWLFRRWLSTNRQTDAILFGFSLGIMVSAKSSGLVFFILYPALVILQTRQFFGRMTRQTIISLIVALLIVNAAYGFHRTLHPLGSFSFFSQTLAGLHPDGRPRRRMENEAGNRFSNTLTGQILVPLPASFVEGVDLQKYDFEARMWSYLRGEHKFGGWWYWYIYALMVKTPVGTILLFLIACAWAMWQVEWKSLARSCLQGCTRLSRVPRLRPGTRRPNALPLAGANLAQVKASEPVLHENLILLAPAVCLFVLVSSQTGFSRYLRYVLPCYPFVFIWMSQIFSEKSGLPAWMRKVCWGLLAWSVFSSLSVFPHSMSYFNELAGGPENGPAHLIDASIDWGQDVLFLADWVKEHPEAKPLYLSLHVFFDPRVAGIDYEHPPYDPRYVRFRQHLTSDRVGPKPGWYAVSVHQLYSRTKEFAYLFDFPKADMVGYSIYLYHLTEQDVENWNRQHAAEIDAASGKPATK